MERGSFHPSLKRHLMKLKITFLLPVLGWSGGIRVVAIYAHWLAEQGHTVVLVSRSAAAPTLVRKVKSVLRGRGWPKHQPVPESYMDNLNIEHRVVSMERRLQPEDVPLADVLVCTWWETAEWARSLPPDRGVPVHFVQGHEVYDYLPRERCEAVYRLPWRKIVIARWLADVMLQKYGATQVDLVPNAVDHEMFHAPVRVKNSLVTIGTLYHEAPIKGLDVALRALGKVKQRHPELEVLAFGSSPPTGSMAIPDWMELCIAPPQDTLRLLYARCDAWLTTSHTEGFNLMAMEAMACRTPVISTRTGWPAEAVFDGVNGFLCDVGDVDAAAQAACRIVEMDAVQWAQMSSNAFATVEHASWGASSRLFEAALIRAVSDTGLASMNTMNMAGG